MADNYLERKMEEHRSGKATSHTTTPLRSSSLQPGLHLLYPAMKIAVFAYSAPQAQPYVEALRAAGLNVALCCSAGGKEATALAQKTGARLYPDSCTYERLLADFSRIGAAPEYIIDLCNCAPSDSRRIRLSGHADKTAPEVLARELLFLIHPDHKQLLSLQSLFTVG